MEVEAGGEEAVFVHGPVGAGTAAAATAGAEDERPLGADRALAARRHDEGLLPGRPPDAGASRPGRAAALAPAPRRRAVEEEALPVGIGCPCRLVRIRSGVLVRQGARMEWTTGNACDRLTGTYLVRRRGGGPRGGGARGRRRG